MLRAQLAPAPSFKIEPDSNPRVPKTSVAAPPAAGTATAASTRTVPPDLTAAVPGTQLASAPVIFKTPKTSKAAVGNLALITTEPFAIVTDAEPTATVASVAISNGVELAELS